MSTGCSIAIAPMDEDRRRICEARDWLRCGFTSRADVRELQDRIAAKRGQAAAEELVQEMRRQWRIRGEWLAPVREEVEP